MNEENITQEIFQELLDKIVDFDTEHNFKSASLRAGEYLILKDAIKQGITQGKKLMADELKGDLHTK